MSAAGAKRLAPGAVAPPPTVTAPRRPVALPRLDLARLVQRPRWLVGFLVATGVVLAVGAVHAAVGGLDPAGPMGLAYGVAATALMLAAALLGVRRRAMAVPARLGRVQTWAQLHVYGGTLFLLLVLLHSGFRRPRETLGAWLLGLSAWVVLSGLAGVAVRKWIPRVLASGLATETLFERIPELSRELAARADAVAAASSPAVRDFHRKTVRPRLGRPRARFVYFLDVTAGIARRLRPFAFLRQRLGPEERVALDEIEALFRTQLELDAHWTLQRPLRLWLWLHVPVSLVLVGLVALHVWVVLYY